MLHINIQILALFATVVGRENTEYYSAGCLYTGCPLAAKLHKNTAQYFSLLTVVSLISEYALKYLYQATL